MCWVMLILTHIRPSYHRGMCEAKDKKSSANNHVSVTQKVVELGGGVGWEAEKRDW